MYNNVICKTNSNVPLGETRFEIREDYMRTSFNGTKAKTYMIAESKNGSSWGAIGELSRLDLANLAALINKCLAITNE